MSIYEHLSFRTWLDAWYQVKKEANGNFSHRVIARLCQQKSPSFFRDITTGRRTLTEDQEERLVALMKLSTDDEQYFRDLVLFEQASSLEARKEAFDRISSIRRIHFSQSLEGEQYQYLSKWYYPTIREMALCEDFQPTVEWIAARLDPLVSESDITEALQTLQRLGFLTIAEDGSHTVSDVSITTPNQVTGLAVHNYHQQMLQLAKESIERHAENERHMLGVTVSIPESMLPVLKEELNQMAARLLDMCDGTEEAKNVTVQLGLHVFPLQKIGRNECG